MDKYKWIIIGGAILAFVVIMVASLMWKSYRDHVTFETIKGNMLASLRPVPSGAPAWLSDRIEQQKTCLQTATSVVELRRCRMQSRTPFLMHPPVPHHEVPKPGAHEDTD
jgi:hypothetical protein